MIITGSNTPIIFRMPEPIDSIKGISIVLCKYDIVLKSWTDEDLTFLDDMVIAPLSQNETMKFPLGSCSIHLKWLGENGVVKFNKTIDSYIYKHPDETVLGDGEASSTVTDGVIYDVMTNTGSIVVRGYSPFINDHGTWEYFDDRARQYVDTGISAKPTDGKDGLPGKDGVGIVSMRQTTSTVLPSGNNIFTFYTSDGKAASLVVYNGKSYQITDQDYARIASIVESRMYAKGYVTDAWVQKKLDEIWDYIHKKEGLG